MDKLKFISYNVQGFKGNWKRKQVLHWLNREQFDILSIQESHFLLKDLPDWEKDWDGDLFYSVGSNNSGGVCTLIKKGLEYKLISEFKDKDGRWLILVLQIDNIEYIVGTIYGTNDDNTSSLITFLEQLDNIDCQNILIGGDFNFVFDLDLDKWGEIEQQT